MKIIWTDRPPTQKAYWTRDACPAALKAGKEPIYWEDIFDSKGQDMDKPSVVYVWTNKENNKEYVGYKTLPINATNKKIKAF